MRANGGATKAIASGASSNFRDPLTDILLRGGSGMHKTCDRLHLCPQGAGKDRPFPGVAAAPAHLRARVDRQVRRPHAAQLRHQGAARLPRLWNLAKPAIPAVGLRLVSTRKMARQCGTITVSAHFAEWAKQGWNLGNLASVHINVETGGGT
jgi:hypothetical protein